MGKWRYCKLYHTHIPIHTHTHTLAVWQLPSDYSSMGGFSSPIAKDTMPSLKLQKWVRLLRSYNDSCKLSLGKLHGNSLFFHNPYMTIAPCSIAKGTMPSSQKWVWLLRSILGCYNFFIVTPPPRFHAQRVPFILQKQVWLLSWSP